MADSCGPPHRRRRRPTNKSGRKVICVKFQKELPGLDAPPWPGELGQRIYDNVSKDAWKLWEERMKMILNEYRLMPWQKEAQDLVAKHMEDFFFGEGAALPPGYVRSRPSNARRSRSHSLLLPSPSVANRCNAVPATDFASAICVNRLIR